MKRAVRLAVAFLLFALILFCSSSSVSKKAVAPRFSHGKKCLAGKLYWVYDNPVLGKPFKVPVGDGEGNYVQCSEG